MYKKSKRMRNTQGASVDFKKGFISCACMGMLVLLICIADMRGTDCHGIVISTNYKKIVNDIHYYVQVDINGEKKDVEVGRPRYNIGDMIELRYSVVSRQYYVK